MYQFFLVPGKEILPAEAQGQIIQNLFFSVFVKWFISGLILVEVFSPYLSGRNFNDDLAARPYLHGAYEVKQVVRGADTLVAGNWPVKRFFIHRNGYLIFQNNADEMQDYKLSYNKSGETFILEDYQLRKIVLPYRYSSSDSVLTLQFQKDSITYILTGKAVNWRKLPALKNEFHWTSDGG